MMKRKLAVLLLFCIALSGCGFFSERLIEPVSFYYVKTEFDYGRQPGVIVGEEREASGHRDDLSYLLALYLMGPTQDEHRSPLPSGTRILNPKLRGNIITLDLANVMHPLEDADLTLACACLTLTCLDITDADEVAITYEDRIITMSRDSFTLTDDNKGILTTEETQ